MTNWRMAATAAMCACVATGAWAGGMTAASLQAEVASKGAAAVLAGAFSCENGKGYNVVAAGGAGADLGVQLLKASSSACASEMLIQALAQAMQKTPAAVLPYVDTSDQLSHDQICLPMGIEEPDAVTRRNIAASTKALNSVTDPKLAAQKAACLAAIQQVAANLGKAG